MKDASRVFLRRFSYATSLFGVLAFWIGMAMAARQYPSEYDWRYMPISNLLSPVRDPAGYLWASTGLVLCSLCGLCWTVLLARRWNLEDTEKRPRGIRALQFGYFCTISAVVLHPWLLRVQRGHELIALSAFGGLCLGMVRLMFQTVERSFMERIGRFRGHARLPAAILAGAAVFPVLLAALAQMYVHYARPELHWVNLTWRDRGVPVYLSFDFWEWATCVVLSAYLVILSLATGAAYPTGKAEKELH
jgi:hypothetical protein